MNKSAVLLILGLAIAVLAAINEHFRFMGRELMMLVPVGGAVCFIAGLVSRPLWTNPSSVGLLLLTALTGTPIGHVLFQFLYPTVPLMPRLVIDATVFAVATMLFLLSFRGPSVSKT